MSLVAKYIPQTLETDICGHNKAVSILRRLIASEDFGCGAEYVCLTGPAGTGKTSIARCLLNDLDCQGLDRIAISGPDMSVDQVRWLGESFMRYCPVKANGWRCVEVNEFHAMLPRTILALNELFDSIPGKRLMVFTGTQLPADSPDLDAFMSRCKHFELKLDTQAAASYLRGIAVNESLDGKPIADYVELLSKTCKGNFRMALQKIQCGAMLP